MKYTRLAFATRLLAILALAGSLYAGVHALSAYYTFPLLINTTASLPYHCFWARYCPDLPERGSYVALRHPRSSRLLAKQVLGLPGDSIEIRNGQVFVAGSPVGTLQSYGRSGLPLTPISESEVPPQTIFVAGSHSHSFDSRYADFGCVPLNHVEVRLCPIF